MKKYFTVTIVSLLILMTGFAQHKPVGLPTGSVAPAFTAKDNAGNTVALKKLLKEGPVVLIFYRGQWCPYCNKQLKQLEDSLVQIKARHASLIAITPETAEGITQTITKTKASYPIIHDKKLAIMKSYDVAFSVDTATIVKYKKYGIDFDKANGSNSANLPVPAVYIIGKDGKIKYRYFDSNYANRASVKEILEQL